MVSSSSDCSGSASGLIAHIPLAALAGVTAYVGLNLLEWSTWRRLHRMRRVDASAFLMTAVAVLTTNAVAAVAIGCSLYFVRHLVVKLALCNTYRSSSPTRWIPELIAEIMP